MPVQETKEKILSVALTLFAKQGFHAVSIRDICRVVQIKESSLYYHFTNKRALLVELQRRFERLSTQMMRQLDEALSQPCHLCPSSFQQVSQIYFERYLMDPFCNQYLRVLEMEQNNSEEIRQVYTKWMIDEPLRFQGQVFAALLGQNAAPSPDCAYLAVQYYAPIYLYAHRYLLHGELTEERKEAFRQQAGKHVAQFYAAQGGT